MKIVIEHHHDQFNVTLASKEGAQPFLTIRGCRIVDGSKGRFVSWPARKLDNGKYWNHVYASDAFVDAVIRAYDESAPKPRKHAANDDDIPF
jgi:DNA-binding cell septation regulator SpoVG